MDLEDLGDEFLKALDVKDFHCLNCGIYYSSDEHSSCPKCGSEDVEIL
ncbi:MAG: hypothetical protein QXQ18_01190 [Candidatus Aenigmatarchaeota archaeon]